MRRTTPAELPHCQDWSGPLLDTGARCLRTIARALDEADPEGRIEPRSRLLCAALGRLSSLTYEALGGLGRSEEVERAGAMLSLLTKIDDQVIDGLTFHGGFETPREELRERTRAFLAPTLRSIREAKPATDEARCVMAAELGRALCALSGAPSRLARLERVLEAIARGWEVQVEAVRVLTSHPAEVSFDELCAVTRDISGAWLLMIALVGTLPEDAARALSPAEEEAFFAWGAAIQRADALADLGKDLGDGHISSLPAWLVWSSAPRAYLEAHARGDTRAVYALVRSEGVDDACLADASAIDALRERVASLGEVGSLLTWIYVMLARRYLEHGLFVKGDDSNDSTNDSSNASTNASSNTSKERACSAP